MISENYLTNHFEPSFNSWGNILKGVIISPAKHKINVFNIDFNRPGESASEIMWFYSLGWLTKYACSKDCDEKTLTQYLSIFSQLIDNNELDKIYKISSFDHCAASRIRYLCMIYFKFIGNQSIENLIISILKKEIIWFGSLSSVANNNHGMML